MKIFCFQRELGSRSPYQSSIFYSTRTVFYIYNSTESLGVLTFLVPISQNGQTHPNNSNCLSVFNHFWGLALKGLKKEKHCISVKNQPSSDEQKFIT